LPIDPIIKILLGLKKSQAYDAINNDSAKPTIAAV